MTDTWKELPKMKTPRDNFAAIVLNDEQTTTTTRTSVFGSSPKKFLFIAGGYTTGNEPCSNVEFYNFETRKWNDLQNLKIQRAGCVGIRLENSIFICGGSNSDDSGKMCEIYDLKKNIWSRVSDMHFRHFNPIIGTSNSVCPVFCRN